MATVTRPMTADEFFGMPHDHLRHELIRGEVRSMPLHGALHGEAAVHVGARIHRHVDDHRLGATVVASGFHIERDPDTVLAADVAFVRAERVAEIREPDGYPPFAPDLAVEIAEPGDSAAAIDEKTRSWLAAGARMVWNAFPDPRTVRVDRPGVPPVTLREDDEIDGADVLPGFRCRVVDLFA